MARLIGILGLAIILLTGTACEQQPPPETTGRTNPEPETVRQETKEIQNVVWPPLKENTAVKIALDLTAKNYYVVLDCSGSMGEADCSDGLPKLKVAKRSLKKFVNLVSADANLGLLVFQNNAIRELIPLGRNNRDQFASAVDATQHVGGTPLFSAVRQGYLQLEDQGRKQLGYGEYTLVIVTDGEASKGEDPTEIVNWILDFTPVQIHTIGFCIGSNHSLNIQGRTVYKAANNPEQLDRGLQDVLAESEQFDISDFNLN